MHESSSAFTEQTVAGLRVTSELTSALAYTDAESWLRYALDAIVHTVNVPGGVLISNDGVTVAAIGATSRRVDMILQHPSEGETYHPNIIEVLDLDPLAPAGARLALCGDEYAQGQVDLDALMMLGRPLLRMVSMCAESLAVTARCDSSALTSRQ